MKSRAGIFDGVRVGKTPVEEKFSKEKQPLMGL
jgi:hypothetical protein